MAGNLLARTLSRGSFSEAFSDEAVLRAMLAFESALALSQAEAGLIPEDAAKTIEAACATVSLSPGKLAQEGKLGGSLAIPLVKALTGQVRSIAPKAASFVHYGSTSQDVLDTAVALCMRPCLKEADSVLASAVTHFAAHARKYASAIMLGRTMLQPAIPITAGIKIARWASSLNGCREALAAAASKALCLQLGGPVGTLDALGPARAEVRHRVAVRLGLSPSNSWQTQREQWLMLASALSVVVVTIGKIARDIALLSQAEVGEMLESAPKKGVGTSSAMPHKRNPVSCMQAIAAATRAPGLLATLMHAAGQEHERALGGWQAELPTLIDLFDTAGGALDALERIAVGLVVVPDRMKQNLEALQGLVFSERLSRVLMRTMDRSAAQSQVDDWCSVAVAEHRQLRAVAAAARPGLDLEAVFSVDSLVADLAPVLEEELAGL
jgi:3-carboxy-cis,cis-muconate cycloisomerase